MELTKCDLLIHIKCLRATEIKKQNLVEEECLSHMNDVFHSLNSK